MQEKENDNNSSGKNPKGPIFIPKGNGLGWTPNSRRPISYVILLGIIAVIGLIELIVLGKIKI